jgi:methyltransferase (TIGR00027 family)
VYCRLTRFVSICPSGQRALENHFFVDRYSTSSKQGIDCVVNLGAGLDTRPYRLNLPANLKWIEVDFPNIIQLKEDKLSSEKPKCQLQRVSLDLSDRDARKKLFSDIGKNSGKVAILTEGVLPYLTEEQGNPCVIHAFRRVVIAIKDAVYE